MIRTIALATAVAISGCSVIPEKISREKVAERVRTDQEKIYKDQEALTGPVTFPVALARSLKYNLDYRLKVMESALSRGILDVAETDLLPKLVVEAGYSRRSNDSGGTSVGIEDRVISLRPSTSEERAHSMARAELSWNALDFGLSYYRAKQAADDYNIAEERKRKILQNIVQDVRNAYWRAVGAQRLVGEADQLLVQIKAALERSREAERAGLMPPAQALAYQRALLDAMSLVNIKRQEMEFAKRELAALMSVPPGTDFTLAAAAEARLAPAPANLAELELKALESRPELREEDYRARIGQLEARKQIVALLPNLNFFMGARHDSNNFLYNNNWSDGGFNISLNLLRLAALPSINRTNAARDKADEARRLALSMAVITQVRVSVERYRLSVVDYDLAAESTRVDQRMAAVSRAGSNNLLESELEALRTESRAIVSRFQQATSYAAAQASYGRIMNSLGIDLLPEAVRSNDVQTLAAAIEASMRDGEMQTFSAVAAEARAPIYQALRLRIDGAGGEAVSSAVRKAMQRNELPVENNGGTYLLRMELGRQEAGGKPKPAWQMTLTGPDGRAILTASYATHMPREYGERVLAAFAEAAVLSIMPGLREALIVQAATTNATR
jgi:outer membrane protein TolC